jgi:hypothetical protein
MSSDDLSNFIGNLFSGAFHVHYVHAAQHCLGYYEFLRRGEGVFEMPLFLMNILTARLPFIDRSTEVAVIRLESTDDYTKYKSLPAIMKEVLRPTHNADNAIKALSFKVHEKDCTYNYYSLGGAVFTEALKPLMVLTWEVEKTITNDTANYEFIRPVLHINSDCYFRPYPVEKFIIGRFLKAALNTNISCPSNNCRLGSEYNYYTEPLKVEISELHFPLKGTHTPSINTTNEELLKLVSDFKDDIH